MSGTGTPGERRPRRRRASPSERREANAAVEDPGIVLEAALRFLESRPRAVEEVRRRLTAAGYRANLVEAVVERLTALGLLDDEAFGRAWLESRDRAHPRGEWALRAELRLRGVDEATVTQLLAARRAAPADGAADDAGAGPSTPPADPDADAADRVLARAANRLLREPDPRRRRARAYASLARLGFDSEVAREAVGRWLASLAPDDDQA